MMNDTRIDYIHAAPEARKTLWGLERYVRKCGLEQPLLELVKVRASQINGCARCLDMHTKETRAAGETKQRLYLMSAWHEAPCFTDRERAALAWTETVTRIADHGVPDEAYQQMIGCFSEHELIDLTMAVIAINSWNRMSVAFATPVGDDTP